MYRKYISNIVTSSLTEYIKLKQNKMNSKLNISMYKTLEILLKSVKEKKLDNIE